MIKHYILKQYMHSTMILMAIFFSLLAFNSCTSIRDLCAELKPKYIYKEDFCWQWPESEEGKWKRSCWIRTPTGETERSYITLEDQNNTKTKRFLTAFTAYGAIKGGKSAPKGKTFGKFEIDRIMGEHPGSEIMIFLESAKEYFFECKYLDSGAYIADELCRFIWTKEGFHEIIYTNLNGEMTPEEREKWKRVLTNAKVKQTEIRWDPSISYYPDTQCVSQL